MIQKERRLAHIVAVDDIEWFELSPVAGGYATIGRKTGPPDNNTRVFVLLGVDLLSWREIDVDSQDTVEGFMFKHEALLDSRELCWSRVYRVDRKLVQAWLPAEMFGIILQSIQGFRIDGVLAAPISLRYQRPTMLKCKGISLYFEPSNLSGEIADQTDARYAHAVPEVMDEGASLLINTGQFDLPPRRRVHLDTDPRSWAAMLLFSLITIAIHVASGHWMYDSQSDPVMENLPALDWLGIVQNERSFHGLIDNVKVTQFGNRLELVFQGHTPERSADVLERLLPSGSVTQPNDTSLVVEVVR